MRRLLAAILACGGSVQRSRVLLALFSLPLLFCNPAPPVTKAGESHAFTVHDLVMLQRASQPVLSPDGRNIVFVLRSTDLEENKGRSDLWVMQSNGSELRQLTSHPTNDWAPQWLSSNTIAFLSARSGKSAIWKIRIDGGEATLLREFPVDIDHLKVSPDGQTIAFGAETYPQCEDLACTAAEDKKRAEKKSTGKVYDSLFIRHWDTWNDGKRSHLFVTSLASDKATDLLRGIDADSPIRLFGGVEDYDFSPDGKTIALSLKAPMGSQEAWSTNEDIWLVPTDGSAPAKNITTDSLGRDSAPLFTPDGKSLLWLSMKRPGYEADRYRIARMDLASRAVTYLAEDWDRSPSDMTMGRNGDRILMTADNLGQRSVFAMDLRSGKMTEAVHEGHNSNPLDTPAGLVFLRDELTSPADFWVSTAANQEKKLTQLNAEAMAAVRVGSSEQFTFAGAKNETVHAYLVRPVDFDANKKYPVAFLVHGGPQGSFGNLWHYRWNSQPYAGAGFAVISVDFHGSTGYGQAFSDAIRGDWGGAPYEDLMKGLDAALAKYPFLDADRVCALGASYGGYMINFMAGQTDRFRCFVTHDGNLDERMAYFDTEELWFPEWEHGGTPWENPEGYAKHNPIDFVKNWKTPTLVVHSGQDFRVVDTQGISVFTALQRKGIPSRLLYFPDENHWVLKPQNSIQWHDTVIEWINRWARQAAAKK